MKSIYSNCDHRLEKDAVTEARITGDQYQHAAWNFCGYIRYDKVRELWEEEVWRYNSRVETRENIDLLELIASVNEDYGSE